MPAKSPAGPATTGFAVREMGGGPPTQLAAVVLVDRGATLLAWGAIDVQLVPPLVLTCTAKPSDASGPLPSSRLIRKRCFQRSVAVVLPTRLKLGEASAAAPEVVC